MCLYCHNLHISSIVYIYLLSVKIYFRRSCVAFWLFLPQLIQLRYKTCKNINNFCTSHQQFLINNEYMTINATDILVMHNYFSFVGT